MTPALPYAPNHLAPFLSDRAVLLHHQAHELPYAAALLECQASLRQSREGGAIPEKARQRAKRALTEAQAFNQAGLHLHGLYWTSLTTPGQGGAPSAALHEALHAAFGSPKNFVTEAVDLGMSIGSGWVCLVQSPWTRKVELMAIHGHTDGWTPEAQILLPIDVWEHAYYVDYPGKKAEYLNQIWRAIDWEAVSDRLQRGVP